METAYNAETLAVSTRLLLKRGALLAVANWPTVVIQFVARSAVQALLGVPVIGIAILVAVLLGTDLVALFEGPPRNTAAAIASVLRSEPMAFGAFAVVLGLLFATGSVLLFLVKGGTVEVFVAAHRAAGAIERAPLTAHLLRSASRFTLERFVAGCRRLFRPYLVVGLSLLGIYAVTGGVYLATLVYGYRAASDSLPVIGWTVVAAVSVTALVTWITIVNLLYLLVQIAIAVEGRIGAALTAIPGFVRAEFRALTRIFVVVAALFVGATLASALAWSGVGFIAFVPVIGLAVFPLQVVALVIRGLLFEYLGLTVLAAYLALYLEHRTRRRAAVGDPDAEGRLERPA
jgi:hypothetical protein